MNDADQQSEAAPLHPVGSVDNAVRLLQMFQDQRSLRVAEVSRQLGVARSTAHRLLQGLRNHGFVDQEPETRAYVAGPALVRLAVSVVRGLDLRTAARPVMAKLVEELGETVHISVLRGAEIFFVESIETTKSLRVGIRTGLSRPAHSTAAGRVLLAGLEPARLLELLPDADLAPLTARTVTSRAELQEHLAVVRDRGFAISIGETEEEVASVAVPVLDGQGRASAALAVSAPPSRLSVEQAPAIAVALADGARQISAALPM
ncbi:IclR family transcriptional regulator [Geodermatophilus sp. CPCC 206100]|uniref:IclR family transcriptional regulator n=1 Tax=Geodermatophilus sp. CPCC 206100 TaxID=3020054 RepID=UPI003AFFA3B0